jgi:hypothetical protein
VLASDACEAEEIAKEQAACGGDIDWNDAMYGDMKRANVSRLIGLRQFRSAWEP